MSQPLFSKEIVVNRHAAYQTWLYKARLRLLKGEGESPFKQL